MTGEELKQQIALYESADHTVHLDVKVDEDTVWLNRQQLALLFGRDIKTIGKHVGNALREELNGFSVVAKFATTASDGKTYQVEHYNLDMILSVGYRVKSKEGIYFRRWANSVLKQHLVDDYTINRKRLDAPRIQLVSATAGFGSACFDCSLAISSSHTSLGVLYPRSFMGVSLISPTIASSSSCVRSSKLVPLGR